MTIQLHLTHNSLRLELGGTERLWAFHLSPLIDIPLAHIRQVSTDIPETTWRELRAPGTFIGGLIKAGTYYTPNGREFWYVTRDHSALCLTLTPEDYYKQIVVNCQDAVSWMTRITAQLPQP